MMPSQQLATPWDGRPIVLVGLMGVGKSTIGRRLAIRLDVPFIDADTEIETAAGMSIPEIFARFGEPYFRNGERRVIQRLIDGRAKVIATGGGAFVNDETRALILEHALAIWLDADIDVLVDRVARRDNRPLLKGRNPREGAERTRPRAWSVLCDGAGPDIQPAGAARGGGDRDYEGDWAVTTIRVELGARSYPIEVEAGLLHRAGECLAPLSRGRTMVIVTDGNIAMHLATLQAVAGRCGRRQ